MYVYLVCIIFCKCNENKNVLDKHITILALWEGFKQLVPVLNIITIIFGAFSAQIHIHEQVRSIHRSTEL